MEKVCPIMSRPRQGDVQFGNVPLWSSEDEMRKYGYAVINGYPFSDIVPCLKEKCMAWVDGESVLLIV